MNFKKYILPVLTIIFIAAIDQFSKYLIIRNVPLHYEIPVIGDAVVITHIHNSGSAWGILSGKIALLLIITFIVTIGLFYIYHNIVNEDKYRILRCGIVAILGGALGNMIDRIRFGYVTDFIYFKIINFPVFNVADIFVTVTIFVLLFVFIFVYKSEDFDVIMGDKKAVKASAGSEDNEDSEESLDSEGSEESEDDEDSEEDENSKEDESTDDF